MTDAEIVGMIVMVVLLALLQLMVSRAIAPEVTTPRVRQHNDCLRPDDTWLLRHRGDVASCLWCGYHRNEVE